MTQPTRVVDAHVHLWDPARADWYPYLSSGHQLPGVGEMSRSARLFDVPTYRAETARWNVEKLVNVAAATSKHAIDETLHMELVAELEGHPEGIIGSLPPYDSVAHAEAMIDQQMVATRFRGIRPMGRFEHAVPDDDVLRALRDRELIFELMCHPDQLEAAAAALAPHDELVVVVEHTGWPRSTDDEERALWKAGIAALAALGDNVVCKLSGLAMPLESMAADAFAPWIEPAIEAFGVDRCFFASNFPVDGMHGTFDDLYEAFSTITAGLDDESRDKLFAANAERTYRI